MDRRIEDRGFDARPHSFCVAVNHLGQIIQQPERSGQDRRKHDLLAEAAWGLHKPDCSDSYMGVYDAINILITMMERRK